MVNSRLFVFWLSVQLFFSEIFYSIADMQQSKSAEGYLWFVYIHNLPHRKLIYSSADMQQSKSAEGYLCGKLKKSFA